MILSILHTGHHPVFQHWCVRTSMGYYPHFILPMRRSRGFASTTTNFVALFRLAFASAAVPLTLARDRKSPDHYAKGTPSPHSSQRLGTTVKQLVVSSP